MAHRISVHPSGRLIFHDHPSIKAEQALVALGAAATCGCGELLRLWRSHDWTLLPVEIRAAGWRAAQKAFERATYKHDGDPLLIPVRTRVCERARALLRACEQQATALADIMFVGICDGTPAVFVDTDIYETVRIRVPIIPWYTRVYRRGLALINGTLVLWISEDGTEAVAVKNTGGFLSASRARIADGCLVWRKEGSNDD